ncbi:hypothetical protein ACJX0J_026147 [Zea mays]
MIAYFFSFFFFVLSGTATSTGIQSHDNGKYEYEYIVKLTGTSQSALFWWELETKLLHNGSVAAGSTNLDGYVLNIYEYIGFWFISLLGFSFLYIIVISHFFGDLGFNLEYTREFVVVMTNLTLHHLMFSCFFPQGQHILKHQLRKSFLIASTTLA